MKFDLYTSTGEKKGTVEGSDVLFAANINSDLMHRAVIMRLANGRRSVAHTKTRGEVAYSTKKMFRQKGTGNARRGARSTNLLRGGGVTHGPRSVANYAKMMPKKERRAALFSALSVKAEAKDIFAYEGFKADKPSTKQFADILAKMPVGKKHLFVLADKDETLIKSMNNLPDVTYILASYLNPTDVLNYDQICFVGDALAKAESVFTTAK